MGKIIAICNQKGGVGKSTTAAAIVSGLFLLKSKRVLAVDLDAQGNLSFCFGASGTEKHRPTTMDILLREAGVTEAICHTSEGDILPSSRTLAGADMFITETGKEYRLQEALAPVADAYDAIILDTPPALGVITINALTACDSVLIPAQADMFSLQGIEELSGTIETVRKYCNPGLTIEGILLTRFNPRAVLSREISELASTLAAKLNTRLFRTTIRETIVVKEAQISQRSLYTYAPRSNVTLDYMALLDELDMQV